MKSDPEIPIGAAKIVRIKASLTLHLQNSSTAAAALVEPETTIDQLRSEVFEGAMRPATLIARIPVLKAALIAHRPA